MKPIEQLQIFEQILLSYMEMCYMMSVALSVDHVKARNIEREILLWIWHKLDSDIGRMEIKRKFLKVLPWLWDYVDSEEGNKEIKKIILKMMYERSLQNNRVVQKSSVRNITPWEHDALPILNKSGVS